MKSFLDADVLGRLLETSHQAVDDAVGEAVESLRGVALFGEGTTVIGTWDSHVMVSSPPRMYRAEWRETDEGVEFFDVESVAVPRVSAAVVAAESLDISREAVEAMLSGDGEAAARAAESLFDMVIEGVPVTAGSFLEAARQIGHDVRFRRVVESAGLSGGDVTTEAVDDAVERLEAAAQAAAESGTEEGRDIAALCWEAVDAASEAGDVIAAAERFGVARDVREAVQAVRGDVIAAADFARATVAALHSGAR